MSGSPLGPHCTHISITSSVNSSSASSVSKDVSSERLGQHERWKNPLVAFLLVCERKVQSALTLGLVD